MATMKFRGELEIDARRGVIYFHSENGDTLLRIGGLPTPVPEPTGSNLLDIFYNGGYAHLSNSLVALPPEVSAGRAVVDEERFRKEYQGDFSKRTGNAEDARGDEYEEGL